MISFKNGKLTINSAIFLTHILISFVMGITGSITVKYFTSQPAVTEGVMYITAICTAFGGAFIAWISTSTIMLEWMTRRFTSISIFVDVIFVIIAFYGADYPVERYIIYKLIGVFGVDILRNVQKRNINLAMENDGERLSIFNNTCLYYAKRSAVVGVLIGLFMWSFGLAFAVTFAMFLEFAICFIAHLLQIYANYRIQQDVLHKKITVTFIDAINDCLKPRQKKEKQFKIKDPFDQ